MPVRRRTEGEVTMDTQPTSARRMFGIGTVMCVIWLGAATMLVWQAQETEIAHNRVAATSSRSFPFLAFHSHAHPDNLPIR
jgi:hypothetical protein